MKKRTLILSFLSLLASCTNFHNDLDDGLAALGGPQLSSNEIELSTPEQYDTEITVRSGEEWVIGEKPDWVSVKSITATSSTDDSAWYTSPGWRVSIQIARNSGYNRSGTLSFRSASNTAAVSITQAGEKGEEPSGNPSQVPVESITLSVESITLLEGGTAQLTATVLPENATNPSVLWSSSKESVATVDANGLVTALAEGTTTITAKAGDKTATCSVTVSKKVIPVTSVTLNKTSMTLDKGESETLVATVKPDDASNKTVTWSSSNASVASVDQTGKVTAVAGGSATITAQAGEQSATCEITVNVPVTSISLDNTSLALEEGKTAMLTATVLPEDATDKTVTWTSSNAAVATVSDGTVTAVKEGMTTITAKAGDKTATCNVTVSKKVIPVTSVTLNKTSLTLKVGESETLIATVKPDDATEKTVTWSSSDVNIATVDSNGLVIALSAGTVAITAKAGEKSASCAITVLVPVSGISLDNTTLTLEEGSTAELTATVSPADATDKSVTWSSSNASVATVNQNGKVTAVSAGTATVTVTTVDGGKTASCLVTVTSTSSGTSNGHDWIDLGLPSGLKWATMNVGASQPEEYGDYFAWGETEPKSNYDWSTYKWCNGNSSTLTKYCPTDGYWAGSGSPDNKEILELEDDAAHVQWSGDWRLPTNDEWTELRTKCTWQWTARNGVNGYLVTGPSGKSIFLPAGGGRYDWSLDNAGTDGLYWSSSLYTKTPYNAYENSFSSVEYDWGASLRYRGLSVRPVSGKVKVTSVQLNKSTLSLNVGASETLVATVKPENATNKTVTWSSSKSSVASVDQNGKVTAIAAGTATVTVTTVDGGKTASCLVTVTSASSGTSNGHEYVDLGLPSGLKWATCNVGASSPEKYGDYFAWGERAPKSDYSWYTYKWCNGNYNTLTKYCTNNDYWDGTGPMHNKTVLDLEDDAAHVNWGGSWRMPTYSEWEELKTKCTWTWTTQGGKNGYKVTSKTNGHSIFLPAAGDRSNTNLYSAGSNGYYWSLSLDTVNPSYAYFVFFYSDNYCWICDYRFYGFSVRPVYGNSPAEIAVTSVSLNKTNITLLQGESQTLTATVYPSNATNKTVTWSSSKSSVASVDQNGKVTAVSEGTATITAKAGDKSATCSVTVNKATVAVTSVTLNKSSLTLTEGGSETLVATVKPNDATNKIVTWTSSKTTVATVDSNGKVTAVSEGTATITAMAGDKSATCSVTVNKATVLVTSVSLNKSSLTLTEGGSETLVATVKPDDATDKTVTWMSSNTSVATVDSNGKVTAIAEGTATIKAKAGDKTTTCSVSVTSTPEGALHGLFTVSSTGKQVYFAKGNLTYYENTKEWYFAEEQYMFDTDAIITFAWGSSGYNGTPPYSYAPVTSLSGTEYDWGQHCKIVNGGNKAGAWVSLSQEEWKYVLSERPNASSLRRFVSINGKVGLMILPDNWVAPENVDMSSSSFSVPQWKIIESNGAVFLKEEPFVYNDYGNKVYDTPYWTASCAKVYSSYYNYTPQYFTFVSETDSKGYSTGSYAHRLFHDHLLFTHMSGSVRCYVRLASYYN